MFGREKVESLPEPAVPAPAAAPAPVARPVAKPAVPARVTATAPPGATYVAPRTFMRGNLAYESTARIDGHYEGRILTKGDLVIGTGGRVVGDIAAKTVTVEGIVIGDINATDRVAMGAKSVVAGDIRTKRMVMAEGAKMGGRADIDAEHVSSVIRCDTHASHTTDLKSSDWKTESADLESLDRTAAAEADDIESASEDDETQEDIRVPEDLDAPASGESGTPA